MLFFSEHFSGEGFDGCSSFPGFGRQAGFAASLLEEGNAVPVVFDRDLGQEQAAISNHADEETVAPYFDGFGSDELRDRENAEFDLKVASLFERDRAKASVLEGGGSGSVGDGKKHGGDSLNIANASAELPIEIKRREYSARFGEMSAWPLEGELAMFERGEN